MNMRIAVSGTLVGYDVTSGVTLFTEVNRVVRLNNSLCTLPKANDLYRPSSSDKQYRVIGVRKGSTEQLWEIDVREE
jgi:hypothetical protein